MRVTDLPEYQSPWLSAPDLQGKAHRRRILEWTIEEVRQRDGGKVRKVAISFEGARKKLLLNATQAKVLDQAFGELEQWIGRWVILQPGRTSQGQATIEIVIPPAAPASPTPAPAKGGNDGDEGIDNPFDNASA
jgi:hypothetical protein